VVSVWLGILQFVKHDAIAAVNDVAISAQKHYSGDKCAVQNSVTHCITLFALWNVLPFLTGQSIIMIIVLNNRHRHMRLYYAHRKLRTKDIDLTTT